MENPENLEPESLDRPLEGSEGGQHGRPLGNEVGHHVPPLPPPPMSLELPKKAPGLAAFLSLLPGLGNIYNGLYRRGFTFFLIYAGLLALAINVDDHERAFFIPCTVFFFFFNIFDAYRQATLINYGYAAAPADDKSVFDNLSNWGLIPGVALVVLGLYGLFRRYFDIDLSWVLDQWPYAIIAFGGWMIYQAIQQRQDTEGGGIEV